MGIILIGFPLFGLLAGLLVGGISYLVGYGFLLPLIICIAVGAAYPYMMVIQGGSGSTPAFLVISGVVAAVIVCLVAMGQWVPALIGVVVAAAFPAYWYFKTWDPRADLDRLRAGMERLARDEADRD